MGGGLEKGRMMECGRVGLSLPTEALCLGEQRKTVLFYSGAICFAAKVFSGSLKVFSGSLKWETSSRHLQRPW